MDYLLYSGAGGKLQRHSS